MMRRAAAADSNLLVCDLGGSHLSTGRFADDGFVTDVVTVAIIVSTKELLRSDFSTLKNPLRFDCRVFE
jgi:hypothetical protein